MAGQLPDILFDESRYTLGTPERVYFPQTENDLLEAVCCSRDSRTPLTLVGAQTGITGASVPTEGCAALCFSSMRDILRVEKNTDGWPILVCQPGVTLEEVGALLRSPESSDRDIPGIELLRDTQWFYPPDPTELTAQLGGTVATNASGARSYRYGPTRAYVMSLSLVLATGDTLTLKRGRNTFANGQCRLTTENGNTLTVREMSYRSPTIKNAAGYYSTPGMDPIDLLTGSEGTLAAFSEIGIRLLPLPEIVGGMSFFDSRAHAFAFARFLRNCRGVVAIEYFDQTATELLELHKEEISSPLPKMPTGKPAAVYWEFASNGDSSFEDQINIWERELNRHTSSLDDTWSGFDKGEMTRLKAFRHAVPELVNMTVARHREKCPTVRKVGTDTAVPLEAFDNVIDRYLELVSSRDLHAVIFGHLGDCHLHFNLLPRTEEELESALAAYETMMSLATAQGGTVSAEHGIGKIKKPYLAGMVGENALEEMIGVKRTFDPQFLLCPRNLFPVA